MYWHQVEMFMSHFMVTNSLTSPYRHLYNTDTSLSRTVRLVSEMLKIIHSLPL